MSPEESETMYNIIEFRILNQRMVEILDDLNVKKHPLKNQKLNQQLKGIYGVLDKQTKLYNELFEVSKEDTLYFYDVICENAKSVMSQSLLNKALINTFLFCYEKNQKAVAGIFNKIIKEK